MSKNIVVVGGSSGIGEEIVKKSLEEGWNVYNISRSTPSMPGVKQIVLDVTSDFGEIKGLPDQVDGLVYCPGSINLKPFQSLKTDHFQQDLEVNFFGAVKTIKACLKGLRKSQSASVLMFSTVAVKQGMNYHASIAASKGAIEGLVRSLAAEYARSSIRFNAIAPSLVDTPLAQALLSTEEKRKSSSERHPLKKIGSASEIAALSTFLLSDNSSWITGQILGVDGGMSSLKPI